MLQSGRRRGSPPGRSENGTKSAPGRVLMTGRLTLARLRAAAHSRDSVLILMVGVFTVGLAVWELSVPLDLPLANILSNAGMLVPGLAVLWLARRTARETSLTPELSSNSWLVAEDWQRRKTAP